MPIGCFHFGDTALRRRKDLLLRTATRKNTGTCLRVRKVCCLCRSGTEGTFRTLFLCVHSPALPMGVTPDPASLRYGARRTYSKTWPSPFSASRCAEWLGVLHLGACGSRLTPPCSGVAPVRQHGGRTLLIPAEGITRHMRVWRLPSPAAEFSGRVGSRRRNKFRIVRFRMNAKTHSLHCSSSPNRTRCAGLRFGFLV